jgi:transcriptional regulator GlxA family with amidase domain
MSRRCSRAYPDAASSLRNAGATRVPSISIARMSFAWGKDDASLHRLSELAGVSPRHFERAFRQAVGVAPHAYVLQRRIAAAGSRSNQWSSTVISGVSDSL